MTFEKSLWESKGLEIPLAKELFDCYQGDLRAYHTDENGQQHRYQLFQLGSYELPYEGYLRIAFNNTLRRLHSFCHLALDVQRGKENKPILYWRFAPPHVFLEGDLSKSDGRCQLYTRLAIAGLPDSAYEELRIVPLRGGSLG